jgi:hypothetical protein
VLFVVGWVALAAWFVAWVGDYFGLLTLGSNPRNLALIVGLMCLFLGFIKARDAASRLP